jgi:hypothetical protein
MTEANRILAAERAAAVTRICALEEEFARYQQAHAQSMTEANRILAAERAAASTRFCALEEEFARYRAAHANIVRSDQDADNRTG